jgi:hypothetical protein
MVRKYAFYGVTSIWVGAAFCISACDASSGLSAPQVRGPRVQPARWRDISPPLWLLRDPQADSVLREEEDHPEEPQPIIAAARQSIADTALQRRYSTAGSVAPLTSFDGLGYGFSGPAGTFFVNTPPDANGDVGPKHYVQVVNFGFAVFDKSGAVLYGPVKLNTLFSGFGGPCEQWNNGDPIVLYDSMADRWLVSQLAGGSTPNVECIAISQTGDPTGSYYRYGFQYDTPIDYPKIGVWPDAYYVTYASQGPILCALERNKMLAGAAATQQCFNAGSGGPPLPADLDGSRPPPLGAPNPSIRYDVDKLQWFQFHVDWTDFSKSALTGPVTIAGVAPFSVLCNGHPCIAQPSTSQALDSCSAALMNRLAYRNFGDHESLVTTHTVAAGDASGVRWYEFRLDTDRAPIVYQQGTYAPDAAFRWLGSAAMDQAGGIGLAFNASSASMFPSLRFTARHVDDPLGAMSVAEEKLIESTGSQQNNYRWGDYGSMSVDPTDDCTFWFTGEYLDGAGSPQTRIGSFKLDGCPAPAFDFRLQPVSSALRVAPGTSNSVEVATQVVSGAPERLTLSVSALPAGLTAIFAPPELMAGESAVLTLYADASAPATQATTVTIEASSGSFAHSVQLVISVPTAEVSIALTPASVSVGPGGTAAVVVETIGPNGVSGNVELSAVDTPPDVILSFASDFVSVGNSVVLTVAASPAAVAAETRCTVRGRFGTAVSDVPLQIVIKRSASIDRPQGQGCMSTHTAPVATVLCLLWLIASRRRRQRPVAKVCASSDR